MRSRIPAHLGIIPDGNRRWAVAKGFGKDGGYAHGVAPGLALFDACVARGIPEITIYGFTQDNTRRPSAQTRAFTDACVAVAEGIRARGGSLMVVGDRESRLFPDELRAYDRHATEGTRVNFLVNYGWDWDLSGLSRGEGLQSREVPRLDLIVRWGGGRRLSGFLPVQSVYADFFVVDEWWPDFRLSHLDAALHWFAQQDRTLGG